ncbi:AI-2E family transporter [Brachybacterium vulturis]|uniref:AI-2E family transporter n=1 Tax=Brachybacterium vulturis TaxID=2017484 RepID=A0A291GMP4_9MICO|nr:AI-2E family transporter [Brachybacterium vulturis]ATG51342.1 AI-2E family transporter [Brachybacterium vulturis]
MSKLRPTPRAQSLAPEVEEMPIGVRRAASWSWRLIVVVAASALILWGLMQITTIVIPVVIAILLAALLTPVVKVLTRYTFLGRGAASGVALLGLLLVISGMFTLAGRQLVAQFADIQEKAVRGFQGLVGWATSTFQIDTPMINSAIDEGIDQLQQYSGQLVSGAVSTAAVLGNVATGIVVALFTLFFLLSGGAGIWRWVVGLLPPAARVPTHEAFRRGWKALSAYMRTQILVAAVDAFGIAIGMVGLGLGSYAVPIWLLVFLFSFVPLVGAIASGAIAVLLVLVLNNWIGALIMLAIVLVVQQLESNVLQPFLMGKAVELHPLAVFLGVATGALVAGIAGALFAIPVLAFLNATLLYVVGRDPAPDLGHDRGSAEHFAALTRRRPHPAARAAEERKRPMLPGLSSLRPSGARQAAAVEAPRADAAPQRTAAPAHEADAAAPDAAPLDGDTPGQDRVPSEDGVLGQDRLPGQDGVPGHNGEPGQGDAPRTGGA